MIFIITIELLLLMMDINLGLNLIEVV